MSDATDTKSMTIEELTERVMIRADMNALFIRADEAGLSDISDLALGIVDLIDDALGVAIP